MDRAARSPRLPVLTSLPADLSLWYLRIDEGWLGRAANAASPTPAASSGFGVAEHSLSIAYVGGRRVQRGRVSLQGSPHRQPCGLVPVGAVTLITRMVDAISPGDRDRPDRTRAKEAEQSSVCLSHGVDLTRPRRARRGIDERSRRLQGAGPGWAHSPCLPVFASSAPPFSSQYRKGRMKLLATCWLRHLQTGRGCMGEQVMTRTAVVGKPPPSYSAPLSSRTDKSGHYRRRHLRRCRAGRQHGSARLGDQPITRYRILVHSVGA